MNPSSLSVLKSNYFPVPFLLSLGIVSADRKLWPSLWHDTADLMERRLQVRGLVAAPFLLRSCAKLRWFGAGLVQCDIAWWPISCWFDGSLGCSSGVSWRCFWRCDDVRVCALQEKHSERMQVKQVKNPLLQSSTSFS